MFALQEETEDTFENGKAAQAKRCEIIATNAKRTGSKSGEAAGNGKKRKAPGKIEYNDQEESVLMDDGNVTLKVNSENMMRLVDKSLPLMKRRSKYCSVTTPSSECAIFTIQVGDLCNVHAISQVHAPSDYCES